MKSPKDKAVELVNKFLKHSEPLLVIGVPQFSRIESAKQCVLILADEMLEWERINFETETKATEYWDNVKTEIENIKTTKL